jgi:hypothetical protein
MSDLIERLRNREKFVLEGPRYLMQMCEEAADELASLRKDVATLDEVVYALGIEDSHKTPQEAIHELVTEAERQAHEMMERNTENAALTAQLADLKAIHEWDVAHIAQREAELAEAKAALAKKTNDAKLLLEGLTMEATALEAANARIIKMESQRKELDRRIHNQRVANRETWEIVEMRGNCMGSPASRAAYARLSRWLKEQRARAERAEVALEGWEHSQAVTNHVYKQAEARAERAEAELTEVLSRWRACADANTKVEARIVAQANEWRIAYNELAAERNAMRGALENLVEAMSHHGTVMHAYVWRAHIVARTVLTGELVELPSLLDQFKSSLDTRLNNMLCEMKEGHDDSIRAGPGNLDRTIGGVSA